MSILRQNFVSIRFLLPLFRPPRETHNSSLGVGKESGTCEKEKNRGNKWVRVVGRIGDEQVVVRRVDEQTIGDDQIMMN